MRSTILVAALAVAGCVRTIDPAGHTGPDGSKSHPQALELEGNTGEATGIVTYPGGDRIDWKKIELPADAKGNLTLELQWRAPRPGLDLAFDVYNQWFEPLGAVDAKRWNSTRKSARNATAHKKLTIEGAKGIVYVRVYASNRGDAGRYNLEATFAPVSEKKGPTFDEALQEGLKNGTVQIPDPPKLGLVYAPCGDEYDKSNPDCVEHPPACDRDNPDKKNPSCKKLCDKAAKDPKNPDCRQFYDVCTPATWVDPSINPTCDVVPKPTVEKPKPFPYKIVNPEIADGKVIITIAVGKNSPVEVGWEGSLLDGNSKKQQRLEKGGFVVYRVKSGLAYAKMKDKSLSVDDVNRNLDVLIDPPVDWIPPDK